MMSGLKDLKWTKRFFLFPHIFDEINNPSLATLLRATVGFIVLLCCCSPVLPFNPQHSSACLTEAHPHIFLPKFPSHSDLPSLVWNTAV